MIWNFLIVICLLFGTCFSFWAIKHLVMNEEIDTWDGVEEKEMSTSERVIFATVIVIVAFTLSPLGVFFLIYGFIGKLFGDIPKSKKLLPGEQEDKLYY